MKKAWMAMMGVLALALAVGCESGSDSNGDSSGDAPNVAGTWKLTDLTYGKNATVALAQDNQILTGTVDNFNGRHGVVQGTITSGGHMELRLLYPLGQTDLSANVTGNTLSGTWVDHRDGTTAQIAGKKQ